MSEQAPEFGEFQTAEWLEAEGRWLIRDMTEEELATAFPPVPILPNELVNMERDSRINTSRRFDIPGYSSPVFLSGGDEKNLVGLVPFCQIQISLGNGSDTLVWRDNENTEHTLSYEELITLYSLALQYKQQVYEASWALKEMDPLPQDYKDDSHWP
jgi:hypothetical protein